MGATIRAYIESMLNAGSRLRTLTRVYPVTDTSGTPLFTVHGDTVRFTVMYRGRRYSMVCPLRDTLPGRQRNDILKIKNRNNPFLAPCEYFPLELAAYGKGGDASREDIIMCAVPEGLPLTGYLRGNLHKSDRRPLRNLLRNISLMSRSLTADGISHGNLKPANIYVTDTGMPAAANYALYSPGGPDKDRLALLVTALNSWLRGSEPSLFVPMGEAGAFTGDRIARHLRPITAQAEFSSIVPLRNAAAMLDGLLSGEPVAREAVDSAIGLLAGTPFADLSLLIGLLGSTGETGAGFDIVAGSISRAPREDTSLRIDFRECDFVGNVSDTLVRFRCDGMWGYAEPGGRRAGGGYLSAEDFYEGRAKVGTPTGYGLIDRQGEYVMDPVYEMLEWHGPANIAAACRDGVWELYDRMGKALTEGRYEWIGDPDRGIMVASRGGKYGYLDTRGKALTTFRFDEAYTPDHGKALVAVDGRSFLIDV